MIVIRRDLGHFCLARTVATEPGDANWVVPDGMFTIRSHSPRPPGSFAEEDVLESTLR